MSKGLFIIRADQQQELHKVSYTDVVLNKKYQSDSCEVNFYNFQRGKVHSIIPPRDPRSCRTYCILKGNVTVLENGEDLGVGGVLIITEGQGIVNIAVNEDTTILVHGVNCSNFNSLVDTYRQLGQLLQEVQRKDAYTGEHSNRVSRLTQRFAPLCGYLGDRFYELNAAAWYHDVGKLYICDSVLKKPGLFSSTEYAHMQEHPLLGKELLLSHFSERVFIIVSQHHERLDGSGYPYGLQDDAILEEAKIIAICDSFDAMTTDRIYKKAMTSAEALDELQQLSGKLYDSKLVEIFCQMISSGFMV